MKTDLPPTVGGLQERTMSSSKLRRVYEPIGSSQIGVIERVESLGANLQLDRLGHGKFNIEQLYHEIRGKCVKFL